MMKTQMYWIEVRVRETYFRAYQVIEGWKAIREAGPRLYKAIMIYDGLLRGDTSMLYQEFPLLAHASPKPSYPGLNPLPDMDQDLEDVSPDFSDEDFLANFINSV